MNSKNTTITDAPILILGGKGKTGARLAARLSERGAAFKLGSRSGDIKFDWSDDRTWKPALRNAHAVYIAFQPDLAAPGSVAAMEKLTNYAASEGVKHLVLLSGRGETEAQNCEKIIIDSGIDYTIIRASWFCQNFSEGQFLEPILSGHVFLPAGNIPEPFVDADDIADVALAALTEEGHKGAIYDVTGPQLMTFKEAIDEVARVSGRRIQYEQVPMKEYAASLAEYKVPDEIINLITYLFSEVLDGRNANLADGVARALGRRPTDFTTFATKAAATGAWDAP